MRFKSLWLLVLFLCLGTVAGEDSSLPGSMQMAQGAFSEEFLKGFFGMGTGTGADADVDADRFWFGPEFDDVSAASGFFEQFYMESSMTTTLTGVFAPVKIDIAEIQPSRIFFGSGQELAYAQYQSSVAASRGNELWVLKGSDWSQYVIVPVGAGIQLIAFTPSGGQADYYKILQTDSLNTTSERLNLFAGHNSLSFKADKVGRYILLFVLNNQPSNSIIIDVISPPPTAQQMPVPQTGSAMDMPPSTNQPAAAAGAAQGTATGGVTQPYGMPGQYSSSAQTTTTQYQSAASSQYQTTGAGYATGQGAPLTAVGATTAAAAATATATSAGDTPVTIQTSMKGYDVYLDGVMIGKEGSSGDILDGVFNFRVVGGQTHTIRIFDGQNNYEKPMYFEKGVSKVINVPPAITVYSTVIPY